jgi:DNA topoisomerase-2
MYYVPIIPMILVNGAVGIGTGFSTNIPSFNPKDIVNILKHMLQDNGDVETMELTPWYMGFTGTIELQGNGKYVSRGRFQKLSATKVEITELPVGTWTEDFKELLEQMLDKDLKQYESYYTDKKVSFILHFANADMLNNYLAIENNGLTKLENDYKLVSSKNLGITNMYLYNSNGQIQKYDTPLDIILDFYKVRLSFYTKRKENICKQLEDDMDVMRNKIRFIKSVISNELVVSKMKKNELEEYLSRSKYLLVNDTYDYLLRIPIYNLTIDKVDDLEKEFKQHEDNLNNIKSKSEKTMWLDELVLFEKAYETFLAEYQDDVGHVGNKTLGASTSKGKRRQASSK